MLELLHLFFYRYLLFYSDLSLSRIDATVAGQYLNDANVFAVFEEVGGEAAAERMGCDPLVETRQKCALAADLLNRGCRNVFVRFDGGEQPRAERRLFAPVFPKHRKQTRRKR